MIELLSNPFVDFVSRVVLPGLSVLVAIVVVVVLLVTLRRGQPDADAQCLFHKSSATYVLARPATCSIS